VNRQAQILAGVVLVLIGGTALLLSRMQASQQLGRPGVRVAAKSVFDENGGLVATNSVELPESVLNFHSNPMPISTNVTAWLPRDTTYGCRYYEAPDGFGMTLNVILMGSDRTSIHKPEYCLPGQGTSIDRKESRVIPVREPHAYDLPVTCFTVSREIEEKGVRRRVQALYLFWFVADGQISADHNQRMLWMTRDLLTTGVLQRWAYVSCYSVCPPGQEAAVFDRMAELIGAAVPRFQLTAGAPGRLARNP
jgi:hypothetical protein